MNAFVPPDLGVLFARVVQRYQFCGRFTQYYVAAKLRRDPVHADVLNFAQREPFGAVLDIGCGHGQMAVALLESGLATSVTGLDWNEAQLRQADRAGHGCFHSRRQNLADAACLPTADTVLLIDVLYQLDPAIQMQLLSNVIRSSCRLVLIRTLDPERGWRSMLSITAEKIFRRVWPHSGAHVHPLPIERIAMTLGQAGFHVTIAPCWRGTPFANVMLVARRLTGEHDPAAQPADA